MLKARCKFGSNVYAPTRSDATTHAYEDGIRRGAGQREGRQGRYLCPLMIAIMPNAISRQNLSVARATARVANRAKNSNESATRGTKKRDNERTRRGDREVNAGTETDEVKGKEKLLKGKGGDRDAFRAKR